MSNRRFPRTSRVNELLREILADELERLDDTRFELVAISGVEVDRGLEHAVVYIDSLGGVEEDDRAVAALEVVRARLQSAVGRQARLRNTPRLEFRVDHGIRAGERVDEILRGLRSSAAREADVGGLVHDAGTADPPGE